MNEREELIECLYVLLKDEFVATVEKEANGVKLCFGDNKYFSVSVKEI